MNNKKIQEKEEMKKRILSFMLYKGYIGKKVITEEKLMYDIEKEGWLDIPMERIHALLNEKGVLDE